MSTIDITIVDGRREAWIVLGGIGGYICAEPDVRFPSGICGMSVESEPCSEHHPDPADQLTAPYSIGGDHA